MIGLYLRWSGESPPSSDAARFAASLAVGTRRKPETLDTDGASFASAFAQRQRMIHLPSGEVLLFNGHIANRAELRSALGVRSLDDASLYAAAYTAWGDGADMRVIGEFCTILCNPAARRARIGRAPINAPPLHYYNDANCLIVASTPRALFATGVVAQELDEQKIADTLFGNYREGERGWFKNVLRLPVSTRMTFTPGRVVRDAYYDVTALQPVRFKTDGEYVEAANALLEAGARAALDGFSSPAVSISGGFDSQAVAAHALRVMPPHMQLLGFVSVPEQGWDARIPANGFGDERDHVRAFAALHPRFRMETIDAAGLSFDHHLNSMFLLGCVPPRNAGNLHWVHQVDAAAKARGCDVMLTGAMGNVTFSNSGDGMLQSMIADREWGNLLRELRATRDGRSLPRKVLAAFLPFAPPWAFRLLDRYRGKDYDVFDGACPLNRGYAAQMRVAERAADMGHDPDYRPVTDGMARRITMMSNARNEAGDVMQALELLHDIPHRDPTAYRPLLEFCLAIPDDQFRRNGERRWLAKRMLRGMVPDIVLDEKRLGVQAADWHLRLGRDRVSLREELDGLSEDPAMAHRLDLRGLKAALDDWPAETPTGGAQRDRLQLALVRAVTTSRFIRFVDGANSSGRPGDRDAVPITRSRQAAER